MDLQTAAVLVGLASPLVLTAVAWGSYTARLKILEERMRHNESAIISAHARIDAHMGRRQAGFNFDTR